LEDDQLMLEYAAGDLRSFERLFERWARRLHAFFRRSSGSAVDADDLLQATFPEPFSPG
jgi:DNA-directed RNA polymerase specialized sigma24 family protein